MKFFWITFATTILYCLPAFSADRPNIVWLMSEDNSKHYLKMFDENGAETPELQKLADHGVKFTRAFSNSPVCSVARTTLITGCYAPRIGTQYHRTSKAVPMPDGIEMFPALLRKAGYYTANNSKKDYNAIEPNDVWDESSRKATWKNRKNGQPFMFVQTLTTTHESSLHFSKEQMETQKTDTDPDTINVAPYHPDTPTFRYTYARYHDNVKKVSNQFGKVVDELEKDGLLDETFIFYFGDHGGVLPRGKGYVYESGLHVPLIVRIPEKFKHLSPWKPGSTCDGFVSFIDFGPTALNLAGVEVPMGVDGKPFFGKSIAKKEVESRNTTFGYADRFDEKYDMVRTLRKGRFKYMRNYQPFNFDGLQNNYRYKMLAYQEWRELHRAGKLNKAQSQFFEPKNPEALYDLKEDPYEINDLSQDPKYKSVLADMRSQLSSKVEQINDLSFFPESYLVSHAWENPTKFGEDHKKQISELNRISNLSLIPFAKAKGSINRALQSRNPWRRYWAITVCSSHGKAAEEISESIKSDPNQLVAAREAQFLGLIGKINPVSTMKSILGKSTSGIQTAEILNMITLLQDCKSGYDFQLKKADLNPLTLSNDSVMRRLDYLDPEYVFPKRKKKKPNKKSKK